VSNPPEFLLFLGRLHPLLVHLPIAFIVLLAIMELLARSPRFRNANANAGLILAISVPACLFSVLFGWLLSLGGGYQENLLQLHKWTGVATACACLTAAMLYSLNRRAAYRATLMVSVLVLIVASHFGGSLTHGSDYLARYAPEPFRRLFGYSEPKTAPAGNEKGGGDQQVFAAVVEPIFNQNCVSCHGHDKQKASLRLDSYAAILKGGESGPAIVPGRSAASLLVKRIQLPVSSEDHMPPDGKPQPSTDDLALLQWWVDSGAPTTQTVVSLKPPPTISRILDARLRTTLPAPKRLAAKPVEEIQPQLQAISKKLEVPIGQIAPKQQWIECTASLMGTNFGDAELAQLAPLAANIRWLDLGGTAVTDAGLKQVAQMPNLARLHLERTTITDAGIANLADLTELEYLNLYGTAATDASLQTLQRLPKLKQVYLWQTKVTPDAAKGFAESRVDKGQVEKWQQEVQDLQKKIREAQFFVLDTGAVAAASGTNATPINTLCPVSGKPIDASIVVTNDGRVIAFCCNDCKAKFEQDPKPFLAKLEMPKADSPGKAEAKK